MTRKQILDRAITFYAASSDANGLPFSELLETTAKPKQLERAVCSAVRAGVLEIRFEQAEINPHIRRLPRNLIPDFEYSYGRHGLGRACIYPSVEQIAKRVDLAEFKEEPYAYRLWAGGNHLDMVFFDLEVLDRYRDDPRFRYSQHFFGGSINLKDEHYIDEDFSPKDKSFLERFGIGFDEAGHRVLCVLLGDLRQLTPEHQRAWQSSERKDQCKLNEATFKSMFLGEWSEFGSVFEALTEELRIVNAMSMLAFGKPLFLDAFEDRVPPEYGVLLRPTKKEYLNFARVLDVMLSENINQDFFPPWVARSETFQRDGETVVEQVGSIGRLSRWLKRSFRSSDGDPADDVCKPMRLVRSERSKASHRNVEDRFDHAFEDQQRNLILAAYEAVRTLRLIFTNHPRASTVDIPDWLFKGEIKIL